MNTIAALQQENEHFRKQLERERRYNKALLTAIRHRAMSLLKEVKELRQQLNPYTPGEE